MFSPDSQTLFSGGWDKTIRLWRVPTGEPLWTLEGHTKWVWSLALSPDGQTLASGSADNTIRLWRLSPDLDNAETVRILSGHSDWVLCVTFSPDGEFLASGSADRTCALWQAGHSRQQPEAQVWQAGKDRLVQLLRGHTDTVLGVAFCPKGHWLATSSGDTTIKLWQ